MRDIYKTPEIADICDGCESVVNKHLQKLQTLTGRIQCDLLRRFMGERREKYRITTDTRTTTPEADHER